MIARVDLRVGIDLGIKAIPGSVPRKLGPREPKVVEPNILAGLLSFIMVALFYTIASVETRSSSGSLRVAKLWRVFFC